MRSSEAINWQKLLPLLTKRCRSKSRSPLISFNKIHALFLTTGLALHSHHFQQLLLLSFSLHINHINPSHSFSLLLHSPLPPSTFLSHPSLLKASSFSPLFFPLGTALHARLLKTLPFPLHPLLLTSLISLHSRRARAPPAASLSLFHQIPSPDLPARNALLRSSPPRRVLPLFRHFQLHSPPFRPNQTTILALVSACARLPSLAHALWAHAYLLRRNLPLNPFLASAFIHMYSKLGRLDLARQLFVRLPHRDVFCYNAMMGGFAAHGRGRGALGLFEEVVREEGVGPDAVTFLMVLSACSHAGLVEDGRRCFRRMAEFGVSPGLEHYGCFVDLLGRAGRVEEAAELVREMPMEPNGSLVRALLGACRSCGGGLQMDEKVMRKLVELEPNHGGNYVLLSNICADFGRWEGAVLWRKEMKKRGIGKSPGLSYVEIDGVVEEFSIGDQTHPQIKEIHEMIDLISRRFLS